MTHIVSGIVARTDALETIDELKSEQMIPLKEGLSLVPLDQENVSALGVGEGAPIGNFYSLTQELLDVLKRLSRNMQLAYIETEYFGGAGAQGAVVLKDGNIVYGPEIGEIGPINKALSALGVDSGVAHDEFEAVGLHLHRTNSDWRRNR